MPRKPCPLHRAPGLLRLTAMVLSVLAAAPLASGGLGNAFAGDERWQEIARDQGIVVYERRDDIGELPARRAVGMIDAGFHDVLAVLSDVERQVEWMPRSRVVRVLKREDERVTWVYSLTDVPWPAADRDAVLRSEIDVVEPDRLAFIRFSSEGATGLVDEVPGVVRAPRVKGHYRLSALGAGRTRVEYRIDADLGGRLPRAILDWATRQVPLASLLGLRRQVARIRDEPRRFADESITGQRVSGLVPSPAR